MEYTLSVGDIVWFDDRENGIVTRLPDSNFSNIVFIHGDGMYDECSVEHFKAMFAYGAYKIVDHISLQSLFDLIGEANE